MAPIQYFLPGKFPPEQEDTDGLPVYRAQRVDTAEHPQYFAEVEIALIAQVLESVLPNEVSKMSQS